MSSWSPSTPSSTIPLVSDQDSHLLSESLPSPDPFDTSHTGPGGPDLSLSELSLSDKPYSRDSPRFSLLAPPPAPLHLSADQSTVLEDEQEGGLDVDKHDDADNTMMQHAVAEKAREEKLQSDLFILKKLNASFAVLNDALQASMGATRQVAEQLSQTDALLDKYANMLAKSETVTRLIFDERWEGADADEAALIKEREQALERARIEQRKREEAASREAEERARQEAEEAAQREAEECARQEAAAALAAKAPKTRRPGVVGSGVRGVRGTRATATAMASRSARGSSKTASTTSSAISRTRSASAAGSVGSGGGARPSSVASRGSGLPRGVPRKG